MVPLIPRPLPSSSLLLLLHLLLPQAVESPHSSPSSSFRTPRLQRRQNFDTSTLSDSVRWTHALSLAFRSVCVAARSFLVLEFYWTRVCVEMRHVWGVHSFPALTCSSVLSCLSIHSYFSHSSLLSCLKLDKYRDWEQTPYCKFIFHVTWRFFPEQPMYSLRIKTADAFGRHLFYFMNSLRVCARLCLRAESPRSSAPRKRMKRTTAMHLTRWGRMHLFKFVPLCASSCSSLHLYKYSFARVFVKDGRSIPGHRVVEVTTGTHGCVHEICLHPAFGP